jgi:hypothetical protein
MDGYYYQQVRHILRQKAARIGGVPFMTVPQGLAMMGLGGFGILTSLSLPFIILGAVLGYAALLTYQGEFLVLRLVRILKAAVLIQTNNVPTLDLGQQWQMAARQRQTTGAAAVVYTADGVQMVSDVASRKTEE